ncbi:MAG: hypothetical protein KatS3mg089_0358 [Patescibacteria group bacterium]|nr:MAG: hypothetical protein KatS3mg089_0358 [Patescibacteria group bacterium]
MDKHALRERIYKTLLELVTEEGINASGKDELYGCIFGRDSAITVLKILRVTSLPKASSYFDIRRLHDICKTTLLTLVSLQGKKSVIASGEEPGKFIHEFRKDRYEHLLKSAKPWYVYPDGYIRNYDSLDATPLALIAIYRYWKQTRDDSFLLRVISAVESGLNWIISYADKDKDYLVEYELPRDRTYGGLSVQSWTDSYESIQRPDGKLPPYPIAPVEVQGYTWLALKLWSDYYRRTDLTMARTQKFADKLDRHAENMRRQFNRLFLYKDQGYIFPAQALDGTKKQIRTVTGNSLLLLWATYSKNGDKHSILDDAFVSDLVKRSFLPDLFDKDGGVRTMSTLSPTFNPGRDSYHNGSFWPKLNGMSFEGLQTWGFIEEAKLLADASLRPLSYFGTPIELYIKGEDGNYYEFCGRNGQKGCRKQAWSAASALELLTTSVS